ncbi:hypothetical protein LTR28_007372 [Elasticomyces elasticus]|nr:hypothetical protein LTR28_007372 [Elasticomyces elasticus]
MSASEDLSICTACGTQFDVQRQQNPTSCRICDFGIGQRAILLQTPGGNILWDLIAFLDEKTVNFINSKGGLEAIVISHPHYYTTHLEWAERFNCPVYISAEDEIWLNREDDAKSSSRRYIEGTTETILDGVTAVKTGGHFPGSLVLHWDEKLFIADTFVTVPSALYHVDRLPGTTSYAFMWSIPNMLSLPPTEMHKMWRALKPFDFTSTHGAFLGLDVRDVKVKGRVLESMKIQTTHEGYEKHELLDETWH